MIHIKLHALDPERISRQARVFAALSSEARIAIVEALSQRELDVSELVEMLASLACDCSKERSNISKHLAVLRESGIVTFHGDAQRRVYRLEVPCLVKAMHCIIDKGCTSVSCASPE